jgi:predicted metal-dependent hydrolase
MKNAEFRNKAKTFRQRDDFGLWTLDIGLYPLTVSRKGRRVAAMAEQFDTGQLDRHYTGFFELFNQRKYFEAHEVLEHIWLKDRHGPNGSFYKGLIQLAGAFVHLQKKRPQPAASLLKLALANLEKYPATHEQLNLQSTTGLIRQWLAGLQRTDLGDNSLTAANAPRLKLDGSEV